MPPSILRCRNTPSTTCFLSLVPILLPFVNFWLITWLSQYFWQILIFPQPPSFWQTPLHPSRYLLWKRFLWTSLILLYQTVILKIIFFFSPMTLWPLNKQGWYSYITGKSYPLSQVPNPVQTMHLISTWRLDIAQIHWMSDRFAVCCIRVMWMSHFWEKMLMYFKLMWQKDLKGKKLLYTNQTIVTITSHIYSVLTIFWHSLKWLIYTYIIFFNFSSNPMRLLLYPTL